LKLHFVYIYICFLGFLGFSGEWVASFEFFELDFVFLSKWVRWFQAPLCMFSFVGWVVLSCCA
jgi:hypothetical protein